jgi:hypothetical protein
MDSFNGSASAWASDPRINPKIPLCPRPSETMVVEQMVPVTILKNSLLDQEKAMAFPLILEL